PGPQSVARAASRRWDGFPSRESACQQPQKREPAVHRASDLILLLIRKAAANLRPFATPPPGGAAALSFESRCKHHLTPWQPGEDPLHQGSLSAATSRPDLGNFAGS